MSKKLELRDHKNNLFRGNINKIKNIIITDGNETYKGSINKNNSIHLFSSDYKNILLGELKNDNSVSLDDSFGNTWIGIIYDK